MGNNPSFFDDDLQNPVETVSWESCQVFCQKISRLTWKSYRLPSEAEWEYACRAGTQTRYSFGDDASWLGKYAWYEDNSNQRTHPVGQKQPNPWGLYDMHGNVWEWCEDVWRDSYQGAPTDGSARTQWTEDYYKKRLRAVRGGSWFYSPEDVRSASRTLDYKENELRVADVHDFGLRLVLEL